MHFTPVASERSRALHRTSTRIKNSTKPTFIHQMPTFYRCPQCGEFFARIGKHGAEHRISCCGQELTALIVHAADDALAQQHLPFMTISGGFEANTLSVTVGTPPHPMEPDHHLEWIFVYTFQGGQFKFLQPNALPEATFALAGEDAYVYCDRPVCKGRQCKFNCKRGFVAYTWCNQHGLWQYAF
ncbi:TPA: desulfoferrodoxin family protein [Citrobacter freundii]